MTNADLIRGKVLELRTAPAAVQLDPFQRRDEIDHFCREYIPPEFPYEDHVEAEGQVYNLQSERFKAIVPFVVWLHIRGVGRIPL